MGITGLLPILKPVLEKKHIKSFKNKRIGIDGFAWLYPILNFVAEELYLDCPTTKYIKMFERKIKILIDNNIIPLVVFDGDSLLSKEKTNQERRIRKEKYKEEIEKLIAKNMYSKAKELMKRCISVSRKVVYDISKLLKTLNIEYIIAPYEADAQLYFLEKIKYIDFILTEDSDLIPYGCNNILFKFDGLLVDHYTIECLEKAKDIIFKENIQNICILSGCDYADSIPGIGVLTAHKLISKFKSIEKIVEFMKYKKKVPADYIENFNKAKITFNHHIVYNPLNQKRQNITPIVEKYNFLGTLTDVEYFFEYDNLLCFNGENKKKIIVNRHFIPKPKNKEIVFKEIKVSKKDYTDENLYSPYFKN